MTEHAPATVRRRRATIADDTYVLAGRPLRAGVRLADTSRFAEEVWVMKPAQLQRHQTDLVIDFRSIPEQFRRVAKEIVYTLLRGDLPPGCEAIRTIDTIRGYSTWLRNALSWLAERGITELADVTRTDIEAFVGSIDKRRVRQDTKDSHLRGLRMLWLCRSKTSSALAFDPADIVAADPEQVSPRSRARRENVTDRIPEQIHAPYLVWAMRWIDEFADDILAAYEEWQVLHRWTSPNRRRRGEKPIGTDHGAKAVAKVLACYRAEGRALPGWRGDVNRSHLAREAEVERTALSADRRAGKMVTAVAAELGIAQGTYLRSPVHGLLDGKPWTGPIEYDDIETLTRLLQTACYIVIALLSGMRDSEVKHIQRGCVSVWRDAENNIVRRRLKSLAFKGETDENGVEATWVISAPAQRAVDVLERLQPAGHYLFALLLPSRGYISKGGSDVTRTTATTNADLIAFGRWINDYCQRTGRSDSVPLVNKQEWRITTRQFRRTLAWFIARRPGGAIAGALQYRHLRIQMFEGYAGTSDSGFRNEVEAEEAIARGEKLGDLILSEEFHQLSGPAAAEAESRLASFERHVQFHGMVINDPKRLQRHMKRHDPHIYPGQYVTCIHNPDRALCHLGNDPNRPSLRDCQPLRCRNVALTAENITQMKQALTELEDELARGDQLAPFISHRLRVRHKEISDFLTTVQPSGTEMERS